MEIGGTGKVKIGVMCSSFCNLSGGRIEISSSEGEVVANGLLREHPFPGTDSLHWTELEFKVPRTEGFYEWTARFTGLEQGLRHEGVSNRFGLMTAAPACHDLEISVVDSATRTPLDNAYVRVGGRTVFTDQRGIATVRVPNAKSEFVVWKRNYRMSRTTIEVSENDKTMVELLHSPCKYCPDST
jgi:hypothetical protein